MRILYIYSGKARQGAGGLDLVVRQQMQALVEAGHQITFVARGRFEHPNVSNFCLRVTPAHVFSSLPSRYYYCAQHRFFSLLGSMFLRCKRYDAVIGWVQQSRSLLRVADKRGIPSFLNCTASYFKLFAERDQTPYAWPYTQERYIDEEYRLADTMLVPSLYARDTYLQSGFSEDKVRYVGRGADVERFTPADVSEATFRLVFFGLVSDRKGIFQALEAWRLADVANGEFWIIGHIMDEVRDGLMQRLPQNAVLKGFTKTPEVLLRQCHAQILPTYFEGMAKSLVEGAACGLVSITTPESGFPVVEGETGFYVAREETQRMAELIRQLATDIPLREKMSGRARDYVREELTWASFRQRFVSIVESKAKPRESSAR